jgi:lipopolysaccharide export system permease protein
MFSLIDRYISKIFVGYFLGGIVVFVTLFVTIDYMSNFARVDAPLEAVGRFYALSLPALIHQMVPVGCLMATVFTLSNLSRSNELIALFASGMSLARICWPILFWVVAMSSMSFFVNDRMAPVLNQRKNFVYYVEILKKPGLYSTVKTDRIWYRSGNSLYNIKTLQGEEKAARGLTMYQFDQEWHLAQMITADRVKLDGTNWELAEGTVTLFPKGSGVPVTKPFQRKTITVAEDSKDLQDSGRSTDSLSLKELERYIRKNKEAGLDTLRYEVDYQAKLSFAFAGLVMALIGIPFSVGKARSGGTAANVGITIGLAFAYWAFYSSGLTLGRHAAIAPALAAWVPNVLMAGLAIFALMRLKK